MNKQHICEYLEAIFIDNEFIDYQDFNFKFLLGEKSTSKILELEKLHPEDIVLASGDGVTVMSLINTLLKNTSRQKLTATIAKHDNELIKLEIT